MAPKFNTLTIKEVRQETEDCVSVAFQIPEALSSNYSFIQGQYLTLRETIDGEDVRRSYSICSGVEEPDLRVAIKKVYEGKFSTYANEQLKAGTEMQVMTPAGKFYTTLDPKQAKNYVLFAAGSGITPMLSIMKSVLNIEPKSTISLFYGNKTTDSVIFKEQIEALKNKNLSRLKVHYIMSREILQSDLFTGRIDKAKCDQFLNLLIQQDTVDEFFVCGPYQMTMDVRESLEGAGVDKSKIHFELFTTEPVGTANTNKAQKPAQEINAKVKVILDGHEHDFNIYKSDETVLNTALKNGADLPFACKGGVCATCKAKLEQGTIDMKVNYGLEPEEIEAGFILTCQAVPTSDEVTVNFDV